MYKLCIFFNVKMNWLIVIFMVFFLFFDVIDFIMDGIFYDKVKLNLNNVLSNEDVKDYKVIILIFVVVGIMVILINIGLFIVIVIC